MEDIVYEDLVDDFTETYARGNLWLLDTDQVPGHDTVVFDAGGDGLLNSPYDWTAPLSVFYEGVGGGGFTLIPSPEGGYHIEIRSPGLY